MVFRTQSRHVEFLLTYRCSQSALTVKFEGILYNNSEPDAAVQQHKAK